MVKYQKMVYYQLIRFKNKNINYNMRKKIKSILVTMLLLCSTLISKANIVNNDWSNVIEAISYVESRHNPRAVSKCGRWVGCLQISKGLVTACNRIVGYKKYTFNDRYSKEKSIEMFYLFQNKYNPTGSIEKGIRMWNGGTGYSVKGTNGYYKKVMKKYNEIIKEG